MTYLGFKRMLMKMKLKKLIRSLPWNSILTKIEHHRLQTRSKRLVRHLHVWIMRKKENYMMSMELKKTSIKDIPSNFTKKNLTRMIFSECFSEGASLSQACKEDITIKEEDNIIIDNKISKHSNKIKIQVTYYSCKWDLYF